MDTMPDDTNRLRSLAARLRQRQQCLQAIRDFFTARDFLEVHTPIRLPAPALEDYIDAEPAGNWFLRTSPELHMKRLLAAGYPRLFQIGPCFRSGECGRLHEPEFTMLEWYRADADYRDILADTTALLQSVAGAVLGRPAGTFRQNTIRFDQPPREYSVDEAFAAFAGCTVAAALAAGPGEFERLLVERVEPRLDRDRPVILRDYPAEFGALARAKPGHPDRVERWELYLGGVEIANAFSELVDAAEQRRRFSATAAQRRAEGRPVYPLDEHFLAALETGLPPCGGIALGVDRLLLVLTDAPTLQDVIAFPNAQA